VGNKAEKAVGCLAAGLAKIRSRSILESKDFVFSKKTVSLRIGGLAMELAKISARGQITLPLPIRKRLGVTDGGKIVFLEENGQVIVENAFTIEQKVLPESQSRQALDSPVQKQRSRADAVKEIRKLRTRCKPVTVDEIFAWRNEGRP
jgi:AbrB family looped-hinge helix DNA binding protein